MGQVQIEFTDRHLTAWGGLCAVVGKFFERVGLREWVERNVPIEEKSNNSGGVFGKVLALMLTCLCGGRRFAHMAAWTHGVEAVRAAFNLDERELPRSPSAITRGLAGKFTERKSNMLRGAARELAGRLAVRGGEREETLALDSTVMTRYGLQDGALKGYNPEKPGRASQHPMVATLLCSRLVINMANRSGDAHTANNAEHFHAEALAALPPCVKITLTLADSGFCGEGFLAYLEKAGAAYIASSRFTPGMLAAIQTVQGWREIGEGIEVAEGSVQLQGWSQARRVAFVRQDTFERPHATGRQPELLKDIEDWSHYRVGAFVTSLGGEVPAEEVWRGYCRRANIENTVKELKGGYGWDSFNVSDFWGTEAVMVLLGMVLHNLIVTLNAEIIKTCDAPLATLATLRLKVLGIPATLGSAARRQVLRLGVKDRSMRSKILYWLRRIGDLSLCIGYCNAVGPPGAAGLLETKGGGV